MIVGFISLWSFKLQSMPVDDSCRPNSVLLVEMLHVMSRMTFSIAFFLECLRSSCNLSSVYDYVIRVSF